MSHPEFSADRWQQKLTPTVVDHPEALERFLLTDSPINVVAAEYYRHLAIKNGVDLGASVPVDRFVFGRGEPFHRHLSKVNGLPYRPRGKPWPQDSDGKPMVFLVQFCFADSRDVVDDLPGDVLLVFVRAYGEPHALPLLNSLVFEWYPLKMSNLTDDVPSPPFTFPRCYGERNRSVDYTEEPKAIDSISRVVPLAAFPNNEFARHLVFKNITCYPRMKIGGSPYYYKPPEDSSRGRYLGGFAGVNLVFDCPFPFVNESAPLGLRESIAAEYYLNFRDGCYVNLFLLENGTVDWYIDFA